MQKQITLLILCIISYLLAEGGWVKEQLPVPLYTLRDGLKLSPDKKFLVGYGDSKIVLYDIEKKVEKVVFTPNSQNSHGPLISWSYDSKRVMFPELCLDSSNQFYTCMIIYNIETEQADSVLTGSYYAYFSPTANKICYAVENNLLVWNITTNQTDTVHTLESGTYRHYLWGQNSDRFLGAVYPISESYNRLLIIDTENGTTKVINDSLEGVDPKLHTNLFINDSNYTVAFSKKLHDNELQVYKSVNDSIYTYSMAAPYFEYEMTGYMPESIDSGKTIFVQSMLIGTNPFPSFILKIDTNAHTIESLYGQYNFDIWAGYTIVFHQLVSHQELFFITAYADNSGYCGPMTLSRAYLDVSIDETNLNLTSTLKSIYPNPFNATTLINYDLTADSDIKLLVYNAKGELVKKLYTGHQPAGQHNATFNATGLNSGVYFIKLISKNHTETRKIMLIK